MPWIYYQSSGKLELSGNIIATGYSGAIGYKNNPDKQNLKSLGPIPKGRYRIGTPRNSASTGPYILPLTPINHTAYGRSDFQIHGDSLRTPGAASSGCIIMPKSVRERIVNSGINTLEVKR